jgi:hypothetical protein
MAPLSETERARLAERLAACLELADRGATAGERDAGLAGARRILERHKMTWRDIVTAPAYPSPCARPPAWRETVAACLARPGCLRPWERGFLESLQSFRRISVKQRDCLTNIAERLGVA